MKHNTTNVYLTCGISSYELVQTQPSQLTVERLLCKQNRSLISAKGSSYYGLVKVETISL